MTTIPTTAPMTNADSAAYALAAYAADLEARRAYVDMWMNGSRGCPLTRYTRTSFRLADRLAIEAKKPTARQEWFLSECEDCGCEIDVNRDGDRTMCDCTVAA
ncbi:hypothetical protein [Kitasatospora sp. NPDC058046]|uniref:hypothetical protein n=1 Tax=Kitasatospora sp. NPDC058046 TaxID=3346312 RepID=UPI0036D9D4D7